MRRSGVWLVFLLGIGVGAVATAYRFTNRTVVTAQPVAAHSTVPGQWRAYFSPQGGCAEAIITEINQARVRILVQAYSFTSEPIAAALIAAQRRGVAVALLIDKGQSAERSQADELAAAGAEVLVDDRHAIAHNKVMILDDQVVITGSFNFTKAAEQRNAENVLILHQPELARLYTANWQQHRAHSRPWQ